MGSGIPIAGDRSAFDMGYPDLHASDIADDTYLHHVPQGTEADQIASWDGAKWVATDPLSVATPGLIQLIKKDGGGVFTYPCTAAGLEDALTGIYTETGDLVLLPPCNISGDFTVAYNMTLMGTNRDICIITGSIILATTSPSTLANLTLTKAYNDSSNHYGVKGKGTIENCYILVSQAGTGEIHAVEVTGNDISIRSSKVTAGCTPGTAAKAYAGYYTKGGVITFENCNLNATTSIYNSDDNSSSFVPINGCCTGWKAGTSIMLVHPDQYGGSLVNNNLNVQGEYGVCYMQLSGISPYGAYCDFALENNTELYASMDIRRFATVTTANAPRIEFVLGDDKVIDFRLNLDSWDLYIDNALAASGDIIVPTSAYQWHHIELHLVIASSGSIELKVDGATDYTYTGDTLPGTSDQLATMTLRMVDGSEGGWQVTNMAVGTTDWPNNIVYQALLPDSDESNTGWALDQIPEGYTDTTLYGALDDIAELPYVKASVQNSKYLCGYPDELDGDALYYVIYTIGNAVESGTPTIKVVESLDGTERESADVSPPENDRPYWFTHTNMPGSVDITQDRIRALQLGTKLTTVDEPITIVFQAMEIAYRKGGVYTWNCTSIQNTLHDQTLSGDLVSWQQSQDVQIYYNDSDVSNPPTAAELTAALGSPALRGAGWRALVDDNGAGTSVYLVISDGTYWWYQALTKAT